LLKDGYKQRLPLRASPQEGLQPADDLVWHCAIPLIETSVELILSDGVQPKELRAISTNME
jgi:hypothetical protein